MTCHDALSYFGAFFLKGPVLSALPLYTDRIHNVIGLLLQNICSGLELLWDDFPKTSPSETWTNPPTSMVGSNLGFLGGKCLCTAHKWYQCCQGLNSRCVLYSNEGTLINVAEQIASENYYSRRVCFPKLHQRSNK